MAWEGVVVIDTDKPDVGYATATWNKGLTDEFIYGPVRGKFTQAVLNAFVADAKAALAARQARSVTEGNYSTTLTNALNA